VDVGLWRRTVTADRVDVQVRPEVALAPEQVQALEDAAAAFGRFLKRDASLTVDAVPA
jgi:hypothetical protein